MAISTTSGTYTWTQTATKIATRAVRQCAGIETGEELEAQELVDALDALNAMLKEWQARGIHVWTEEEGILFLQSGQYRYALGATSADFAADWQSWYQTSLAAAAVAGAGTISVASSANLASGQNIAIELGSGLFQWTTINGAPAGSTVTLTNALTGPASSGATIIAYAPANGLTGATGVRPLRITGARRFLYATPGDFPTETPMVQMSRQVFMDLPQKAGTTGPPSQYFYEPKIGAWQSAGTQLGPGYFYAWATPNDVTNAVRFTWLRPIQDVANGAQLIDLPIEWVNCITRNLALELAVEYEVVAARYQILEKRASDSLMLVTGWDVEPESTTFGVSYDPSAR